MDKQIEFLKQAQTTLVDMAIKFGPKVLVAIGILIVGVLVGRWVGRLMGRMFEKLHLEIAVRRLLERIVRLVVLGLFLIIALQNLGVELLPLLAGLGVAGAGIALAMQGVLGNVVAGLTIVFTKPFKIGEYISIVGKEGVVEDINTFSTTLSHADRSRVVIPNRKIVGEILHNYGNVRQMEFTIGVAYATNVRDALAAIREVLVANSRVLKEPAPIVQICALADSSINIIAKPWVSPADFGPATGEIYQAIVEKMRERNISIPFPQREVRLLSTTALPVQ